MTSLASKSSFGLNALMSTRLLLNRGVSCNLISTSDSLGSIQCRSMTTQTQQKRRRRKMFETIRPLPTAEEAVTNILYNTPAASRDPVVRHILNCLVTNEPGVLSRVSGILAARGFNIDSLVVSKTEIPDLSRMTIVLQGQDATIEQAKRQLEDLVPVWAVLDYTKSKIIEREMLLAKVSTVPGHFVDDMTESELETAEESGTLNVESTGISPLLSTSMQRDSLLQLTKLFGGHVLDVSHESVILQLCAKSSRVDAFLKLIKPYGIIESSRSGVMAMARSQLDFDDDAQSSDLEESGPNVDATMLPPG